jgi:hypothetical protein
MKTENLGVITSIKNLGDSPIEQGMFVGVSGVTFNSSEDNNRSLGVAIAETEVGEMVPVAVTGIALAKAGGAISIGSLISCDTYAYQINLSDPPTASELKRVVGKALDTASGAGELIRVLIK